MSQTFTSQLKPKMYKKTVDPMITIVDDSGDVRRSVMRLLETIGIQSQSYENAQALIDSLEDIDPSVPGCLIIDLRLPDMDGLDMLETLRCKGVTKPAIIITAYGDVPSVVRAMKVKVSDFIEKPFSEQMFLAAVHKAIDKDKEISRSADEKREIHEKISRLSERERQVLKGILRTKSSKQIANHLNLSAKTVENYRASLMDKMEARNIAHLITLVFNEFSTD